MALTHSDFMTYPLQIIGIDQSIFDDEEKKIFIYDAEIEEIEKHVVEEMAYVGAVDVSAAIPYFVFYFFCKNNATSVVVEVGENEQIKEFSQPSIMKQVDAWNKGVDILRKKLGINFDLLFPRNYPLTPEKLRAILRSKEISINQRYLTKIKLL